MTNETKGIALLLLAALIWGTAFVAQSVGASYIGPFSFLAARSWLGTLSILPLALTAKKTNVKHSLKAGVLCGLFLFLASLAQQIGIASTTTAKSGFITSLYMIIVPIMAYLMHKPISKNLPKACILALIGLVLLCFQNSLSIEMGDVWTLASAFLFACQILMIENTIQGCDIFMMNVGQFAGCALLASLFSFTEATTPTNFTLAIPAILYAGILSTGVAFTLQLVGQKALPATTAGLVMCLEAVFSALAGWLFLGQALSIQQILGCALLFLSIVLVQRPAN